MWPLEHARGKKLMADDGQHKQHDGHRTITLAHSVLKCARKHQVKNKVT